MCACVIKVYAKEQENYFFFYHVNLSEVMYMSCIPCLLYISIFLPFLAVHISFLRFHTLHSLIEQAQGTVSCRLKRAITQGSLDPKQSMTALQL